MFAFLWGMRPYFRQVAGQLVLGSVSGIIMNTAVVLPAILLGRAIDRVLSLERGEATAVDVGWAALAFIGGTLLTEVPRIGKRWWLMTANARIRANVRADAFRGVLAWPMADLQRTPLGDLMARIVGDVEVLGVGVREFTIETWDTVLFSLSFVAAMLVIDPRLTLLALSPVPLAMLLAHAAGRWVTGRSTKAREAIADLTSAIQEHLAGIRVLRLFGRASASVERVAALSGRCAERNLSVVRLRGGLQPVYTTLMTAGVFLIVWQGSERVVAGALIGVTGPVGSGKTALTRAILGLYPLESGSVLIDGWPVEELPASERTGLIGYLPQNALLFSGSLRENVTLTPEGAAAGDDFLMRAMRLAVLEEDVRAFPHGLDTDIGELGIRISGGQRQRVGLARAMAAAAPGYPGLLVLDDPFSAVDVATEARIVAALRHAFGPDAPLEQRVTIVVCSHRLAAFPHADAVMVLREGRIEEKGTHAELVESRGLYGRIYRAQRVAEMTAGNGALR